MRFSGGTKAKASALVQNSVAEHDFPMDTPRAWVAQGWMRTDGHRAELGDAGAIRVFAVSVHERVSAAPESRLRLLCDLARGLGRGVAPNTYSLWVLPGGYFGFDSYRRDWIELTEDEMRAIQRRILSDVLPLFPARSTVVLGMDPDDRQFVWAGQIDGSGRTAEVCNAERHHADLQRRRIDVGGLIASCFVCGEFCGSRTANNGPFDADAAPPQFLDDPVRQLRDTRLLIDLAHSRVSGTIVAESAPQRLSHQRQLERFAPHGAGLLVHHHAGQLTAGRPASKHQSGWLIYRGGRWLEESAVSVFR